MKVIYRVITVHYGTDASCRNLKCGLEPPAVAREQRNLPLARHLSRVVRGDRGHVRLAARPGTRGRDFQVGLAARGLQAHIRLLDLDLSVGASPGYPSQLRAPRLDSQRLRQPERQPVAASTDIPADGADREAAAPESRYPRTMPCRRLSVRCAPACALPSSVQSLPRRRDVGSPARTVPVPSSPKAPPPRHIIAPPLTPGACRLGNSTVFDPKTATSGVPSEGQVRVNRAGPSPDPPDTQRDPAPRMP